MAELIPQPQIPTGLAAEVGRMMQQNAQIIPNAIAGATNNISGAVMDMAKRKQELRMRKEALDLEMQMHKTMEAHKRATDTYQEIIKNGAGVQPQTIGRGGMDFGGLNLSRQMQVPGQNSVDLGALHEAMGNLPKGSSEYRGVMFDPSRLEKTIQVTDEMKKNNSILANYPTGHKLPEREFANIVELTQKLQNARELAKQRAMLNLKNLHDEEKLGLQKQTSFNRWIFGPTGANSDQLDTLQGDDTIEQEKVYADLRSKWEASMRPGAKITKTADEKPGTLDKILSIFGKSTKKTPANSVEQTKQGLPGLTLR